MPVVEYRPTDEAVQSAHTAGDLAHSGEPTLRAYLEHRLRVVTQEGNELRRLLGREDELTRLRRENAELRKKLRASSRPH